MRKLTNIIWINESLLNLQNLQIGKFDFIDCIGVLHHLKNPDKGLESLKSCLKPDGFMTLMLYAPTGRKNVYKMQNLMRKINKHTGNMHEELKHCKSLLNNSKDDSWIRLFNEKIVMHKSLEIVGSMICFYTHKIDHIIF